MQHLWSVCFMQYLPSWIEETVYSYYLEVLSKGI